MKTEPRVPGQVKVTARAETHPTPKTFLVVGAVLAVLTIIEFSIISVTGMRPLVVTVLFGLSLVKFVLVAGYFMHLRFDGRLLTWIFAVGFLLAMAIAIAQKYVNLA